MSRGGVVARAQLDTAVRVLHQEWHLSRHDPALDMTVTPVDLETFGRGSQPVIASFQPVVGRQAQRATGGSVEVAGLFGALGELADLQAVGGDVAQRGAAVGVAQRFRGCSQVAEGRHQAWDQPAVGAVAGQDGDGVGAGHGKAAVGEALEPRRRIAAENLAPGLPRLETAQDCHPDELIAHTLVEGGDTLIADDDFDRVGVRAPAAVGETEAIRLYYVGMDGVSQRLGMTHRRAARAGTFQ